MKEHSSRVVLGIAASIILGFAILAGVAIGLHSDAGLGYQPPALRATRTGPNSATLNLSTFPDSLVCHPDQGNPQITWVTYCPTTSIELPAYSLITVNIKQYDSSTGLYNGFFQNVQGTVGGVAMYNNKPVSQLKDTKIAHTFTIQSPPDTPNPLFVSVPLGGVPDNAANNVTVNGIQYPTPNIITFQFRTGAPCKCIWHCYVPCGDQQGRNSPFGFSGPMSTTGYMAGTVTVTN